MLISQKERVTDIITDLSLRDYDVEEGVSKCRINGQLQIKQLEIMAYIKSGK